MIPIVESMSRPVSVSKGEYFAQRFRCVLEAKPSDSSFEGIQIYLFGEGWEMSVSVYCLCTEPWGDSQLRTISLFDIISLNS